MLLRHVQISEPAGIHNKIAVNVNAIQTHRVVMLVEKIDSLGIQAPSGRYVVLSAMQKHIVRWADRHHEVDLCC